MTKLIRVLLSILLLLPVGPVWALNGPPTISGPAKTRVPSGQTAGAPQTLGTQSGAQTPSSAQTASAPAVTYTNCANYLTYGSTYVLSGAYGGYVTATLPPGYSYGFCDIYINGQLWSPTIGYSIFYGYGYYAYIWYYVYGQLQTGWIFW